MSKIKIEGGPKPHTKYFSIFVVLFIIIIFFINPVFFIENIKGIFSVPILEFYKPTSFICFLVIFYFIIIYPFKCYFVVTENNFEFNDMHTKIKINHSEIDSYGYYLEQSEIANLENSIRRSYLCFYLKNNKKIEIPTSWTNLDNLENFAEKNYKKKDIKIRSF